MEFNTFDLIIVIALIQSFLAGMVFSEEWSWARTWFDKCIAVGKTIIVLVAGAPIGILLFAIWPFWKAGEYIWKNLNVGFIVKYMILRMPFRAIPYSIQRVRERFYTQSPRWYQLRKRLNNFVVVWAEVNYIALEE